MMETLKLRIKTITPIFMTGANSEKPELRAPSIKGMLRFWWRAINGDLKLGELRSQEKVFFGSAGEDLIKSKFSLQVRYIDSIDSSYKAYPLPHHTGDSKCGYLNRVPNCEKNGKCNKHFPSTAIAPDKTFELIIRTKGEHITYIQNILTASFILGGFGKRSRRGFGSMKIVKINNTDFNFDYSLNAICKLLNSISNKTFGVEGDRIKKLVTAGNNYPYIEEIRIGESIPDCNKLLKLIGESSHKNDCEQTGFSKGRERFASPIYVSIINVDNTYKPIITRLHTAYNRGFTTPDRTETFILDILKGGL